MSTSAPKKLGAKATLRTTALMPRIEATKARSSSLYAWFGNRTGLLADLIRRQADTVTAAVTTALATPAPFRDQLITIAENLLGLLVSPPSPAINRAAMAAPELAELVLQHGRHTTGPLVESYLAANGIPNPGRLPTPLRPGDPRPPNPRPTRRNTPVRPQSGSKSRSRPLPHPDRREYPTWR
ncbi:hypothetical protein V5P93_003692 [Actinokineospora auranticolor]|uniref:hypothetical protein n=1 Tax=Actinokineospora auranticolor TaxID=155976 RepID=UPI0011B0D7D1|nr:hypothetical protein [Actinokineospora auranticolor]